MKATADMTPTGVTHRLKQMEGLWLLSKALADAKVLSKNGARRNRSLEIQAAIRAILLREWKSTVSSECAGVDRSYDQHIAPILRILVGSRSKEELVACLQRKKGDETGDDLPNIERLHQMARNLLEMNVMLN